MTRRLLNLGVVLVPLVGVARLDVLVVLQRVVDLREDLVHRVGVARVERQELHHRPVLEQLADGRVEPEEGGARALVQPRAQHRRVGVEQLVEQAAVGQQVALREHLLATPARESLAAKRAASRAMPWAELPHVAVRQLEHRHGGEAGEHAGHELWRVLQEGRVDQVDRGEPKPHALQLGDDAAHCGHVRVELDLARAVKQDVLVPAEVVEFRLEPVNVVDEVLHRVDEPAVRAQPQLAHHVLERHEVADVGRDRVPKVLRRWVEVDDVDAPPLRLAVRAHEVAVCRLAGAGRADDERRAADHFFVRVAPWPWLGAR
eukprot:CAMPEP_0185474374 /NCGR_PEP_ID=MMETSP1366-20130426/1989_1 /TAXON_ID=38817 /ORGANISM="Gephyrocapsa oceanica, Strain RCC1303" /LENGTH=316 /DNA_ID=CAMNT_0028081265 /DNA_START=138 /DNA_END=1085 /DNA_ORIENTATION=-